MKPQNVLFFNPVVCQACDCNGNVDPNAVGNCNRTTNECSKCVYNTAEPRCEQCLPGHFGDPLALPHGNCDQCSCYPPVTEQTEDGISIWSEVSIHRVRDRLDNVTVNLVLLGMSDFQISFKITS